MRKLVACYSVLNEGAFLKYSLQSVLPYVDKVIIVEGAYQNHVPANYNTEYSIDNTWSIIKEFESHPKVTAVHASEADQMRQRGRYLDYLKHDDVLFMVDGDEIYCQEDINWLRVLFRDNPDCYWLRARHIAFANDFKHHWENYPYHKRGRVTAFRYRNEFNYRTIKYDAINLWKNNGSGPLVAHAYNGINAPLSTFRTFHARYLKPNELLAIKGSYYMLHDPRLSKPKFKQKGAMATVKSLLKKNLQSVPSVPYTGKLPDVLKNHPLMEGV